MTATVEGLAVQLLTQVRRATATVPDAVLHSARLHLLDAIGVGALGARRGPLAGIRSLATSVASGGPCTVFGSGARVDAPTAALLNGAFIHSLEFDDTHVASVMHGSSVLAPVAIAAAEQHGVGGRALLTAYTAGWELLIRMGLASPGTLQARGFQTTSAAGPFAAALVAALVAGDSDDVLLDALGVAGSQPGGTFAFLAGGDTVKAVQPGWAAHSGMWATALAGAGVTGPRGVLDGRYGFYRLYAGDDAAAGRLVSELDSLGESWYLPGAAFKLIPCCHFIHPFVEAVGRLVDDGMALSDIGSLHCSVPVGAVPVIADDWAGRQSPAQSHDARWSLPYVLAGFLIDGHVGVDLFNGAVRADCVDTARRITFEPWEDSGFPAVFPARIDVRTREGATLHAEVDDVLGGSARPVAEAAVIAKAIANLTGSGLSETRANEVAGRILEDDDFDIGCVRSALGTAT